ncbi:MAG: hypothetical protein WA880_02265, partial [Ornithinimicrobium sp.]
EHDGRVIKRAASDGTDAQPHEVQFLVFAEKSGLDSYLSDPRRLELSQDQRKAIARTESFPVTFR